MRVARLVFLNTLFSIAYGLKECLEIPSFIFHYADTNSTQKPNYADKVRGQCPPSKYPGAFYTEHQRPFQKGTQLSDDAPWLCWGEATASSMINISDADAEAKAKRRGLAGACTFAAYESATKPDEIAPCTDFHDHNPLECSPGPGRYWGACVPKDAESDKWKCIPKDDTELVAGVVKSDCLSFAVTDDTNQSMYDNVCRFETEEPKPVKCDTVPTYAAKGICSKPSEFGEEIKFLLPYAFRSACFSLTEGISWSCRGNATEETTPCTWTHLDFKSSFYNGECLFPHSPGYNEAADRSAGPPAPPAPASPPVPPPTPVPSPPAPPAPSRPASPSEPTPSPPAARGGSGGRWLVVLVLLMLVCAGGL